MPYQALIQNLKKELDLYLDMGGDIYGGPIHKFPLYNKIRSVIKSCQRETGQTLSMSDVFAACGVKYNKEYHVFGQFVERLGRIADKNGYVDSIKTKAANEEELLAKSYLNHHAKELNLAPGEYLILMTDYRFETLTIAGDYVAHLQSRFQKECPNGTVKNLKAENPSLYWALKHFQTYIPVDLSYDEALGFFGVKNVSVHKPPQQTPRVIDQNKVFEKLDEMYPDHNVVDLIARDLNLYYDIIKLSLQNDQTISQWFNSYSYNYAQANSSARLSKFQVDAKEHEQMLLEMKNEELRHYDLSGADEAEIFMINLEIAQKISQKLYGEQQSAEDKQEADISHTEQESTTLPTIKEAPTQPDCALVEQ
ncbi:MAG: hypothetical protein IJD48_02330 [Clostridia bacterium]|nr:hypothetical protein [Clostridia bacterium]